MSEEKTPNLKHKYGRIDLDYATQLATTPPEQDGPIFMVNLMKYREVAQYADGRDWATSNPRRAIRIHTLHGLRSGSTRAW